MTVSADKRSPGIDIVGASAGTGKTTRLATEFIKAVRGDENRGPVDPTKIIVCTFTKKAAEEISARIRQELLKQGLVDEAQLVLAGYVGTVNSICGRLLKDYALECGLSPHQEVIPEQMQGHLFSIATATVLDAFAQRIEEIAKRLSFTETTKKTRFVRRTHWMDHVRTISNFARANGMSASTLRASAERSWEGMKAHLGSVYEGFDPEELDQLLTAELERVVTGIDASNDPTEVTEKALQELRACFARSRTEGLSWRDWASIKKLEIGQQSRPFIKNLLGAATALPRHPRLHSDLKHYLTSIFECAAESLDAYQAYKAANGLVDFVDQEYLTLSLLDSPSVRASLKSRLELVLIDEFQDTSPIQLALFIKLASIVEQSVWVGDIKQAIYGFRGTDPQLMQKASMLFNQQPPLGQSYRSRPELVEFSNEMFKRVFAEHGMNESDVVIRPSGKRAESHTHTIEVWRCNGQLLTDCFSSVSVAVREFVHGDGAPMIEDPHSGLLRPIRGSDIAILCRKNDHCSKIATALSEQGLRVAMTRDGLLETPECMLTIAALRYLVDASDKVALGTIVHLTRDYQSTDQSAWLREWLSAGYNQDKLLPNQEAFDSARAQLARITIGDSINLAMNLSRVLELVCAWGSAPYRMLNLDALRGLAVEYEDTCAMARTSVTITGFLSYLDQLEESAQPASVDVDAVQVLTYHASKGLEWPVVILADLDSGAAPKVHKDLCKVTVEPASEEFDVSNPLKGRWIRFWPWPFGSIEKDGYFDASAEVSPEFNAAIQRVRAENARLMYVGITRARDMLILAAYVGRKKNDNGIQWLDELQFEGAPVLRLPMKPEEKHIVVGATRHNARHFTFDCTDAGPGLRSPGEATYSPRRPQPNAKTSAALPYFLQPSSLTLAPTTKNVDSAVKLIDIGERIAITGTVDMTLLGECVHSFLAVNDSSANHDEQLALADRIRILWQVDHIKSEDLIIISSRFDAFLKSEFGTHRRYDECPVTARMNSQRLRGIIDVLVEKDNGFHIVDHKTFPGPTEQWAAKAHSYLAQLTAYKHAIEQATSLPVHRLLIHMPIIGKVLELKGTEP
ncbi:MAG: UvrD-helicase domain-containing protein [Candidatus Obscuribacterales bacterium]|nr:UvrD-helicase domain-containing protein [Candidatus Obscuribacterales bacterium]